MASELECRSSVGTESSAALSLVLVVLAVVVAIVDNLNVFGGDFLGVVSTVVVVAVLVSSSFVCPPADRLCSTGTFTFCKKRCRPVW